MEVQRPGFAMAAVLVGKLASADIEGIKFEMAILQNEVNGGNVNSTLSHLKNTVRLFESNQKELGNTIKLHAGVCYF